MPAAIGIYTAILPLLPYALFGSSRQLIVGPDAATCIIVAASLAPLAQGQPERYLALLPVLTLLTGLLYLVAGFGRLGFLASFLSQPILSDSAWPSVDRGGSPTMFHVEHRCADPVLAT